MTKCHIQKKLCVVTLSYYLLFFLCIYICIYIYIHIIYTSVTHIQDVYILLYIYYIYIYFQSLSCHTQGPGPLRLNCKMLKLNPAQLPRHTSKHKISQRHAKTHSCTSASSAAVKGHPCAAIEELRSSFEAACRVARASSRFP